MSHECAIMNLVGFSTSTNGHRDNPPLIVSVVVELVNISRAAQLYIQPAHFKVKVKFLFNFVPVGAVVP